LTCNVNKTVCMMYMPKCSDRVVSQVFPKFQLGDSVLKYVQSFKYLGHIMTNKLNDDEDIAREMRNMFVRTNILLSYFKDFINVHLKLKFYYSNLMLYACIILLCGRCIRLLHSPSYAPVITNA